MYELLQEQAVGKDSALEVLVPLPPAAPLPAAAASSAAAAPAEHLNRCQVTRLKTFQRHNHANVNRSRLYLLYM